MGDIFSCCLDWGSCLSGLFIVLTVYFVYCSNIDRHFFTALYTNVSRKMMDSVFEAYLGPDWAGVAGGITEAEDIPKVNADVWVLGKRYNAIQELELIRRDIQSRLWCTYRRGFVPLGEPQLTTDKGWGCMLRCGQMVLAQALIDLHLGREWFWTSECRDATYLKIVNRFEDSRKSFFSIHQIALMGDSEDKKVGQWFGPNTVAQVLKKLVRYDDWCSLVVHVAMDNIIVTDDIYAQCLENSKNEESWTPLLLIVPLRLGISEINSIYINALKRCFELVGCCGMIGGRPNQALYFIGYVQDQLLYLDPHVTQRSGSVATKTSQDEVDFDETFHQRYAGRLNFEQMDPSLAVSFLCKSRLAFEVLINQLRNDVLNSSSQPLFEITKTRTPEWQSLTTGMGLQSTAATASSENETSSYYPSTSTSFAYEVFDSDLSGLTDSTATPTASATATVTPIRDTAAMAPPCKVTTATSSLSSTQLPRFMGNSNCNRTTSICDSEDFETVPRTPLHGATESDDDFEIIS